MNIQITKREFVRKDGNDHVYRYYFEDADPPPPWMPYPLKYGQDDIVISDEVFSEDGMLAVFESAIIHKIEIKFFESYKAYRTGKIKTN